MHAIVVGHTNIQAVHNTILKQKEKYAAIHSKTPPPTNCGHLSWSRDDHNNAVPLVHNYSIQHAQEKTSLILFFLEISEYMNQ